MRFQRLSSHLSRNEFCGTYYKNMLLDIGNGGGGVTDDMHVPGVAYFNKVGATVGTQESTRIYGRASTLGDMVGDDIPVDQPIPDDDDDDDAFAMSDGDDDSFPCNEESDDDSEDEEVPDGIILDLYQEMQEFQSNQHGLDRFSHAEKVRIELLHLLLKEFKAPLKAFPAS